MIVFVTSPNDAFLAGISWFVFTFYKTYLFMLVFCLEVLSLFNIIIYGEGTYFYLFHVKFFCQCY